MSVNIRHAKKEDCPQIFELIQGLAEHQQSPDEVTVSFSHFEECGFGENPVWKAFIAEANKKIVGYALYYIRFSTWKGKRLYLEDFYVKESMRSRGIGKKLFDRVIKEGKNLKLKGMDWQVIDWNDPAIRFYKRYGTKIDESQYNASLNWPDN
ncbi:MAG TPA: GNAT family N-acetyltransferase [Chitinophagaceae bacterium]|nr:GNAT family N-acetyltransferase [Chitinophagaceae bacterium]